MAAPARIREATRGHGSAVRRDRTMAPTTPPLGHERCGQRVGQPVRLGDALGEPVRDAAGGSPRPIALAVASGPSCAGHEGPDGRDGIEGRPRPAPVPVAPVGPPAVRAAQVAAAPAERGALGPGSRPDRRGDPVADVGRRRPAVGGGRHPRRARRDHRHGHRRALRAVVPVAVDAGRAGWQLQVADRQDGRRARHAGPPADEGGLEDQGLGMETDDDGVVGPGLDVELGDDGLDDRIGRHRARKSLEDAGDALGLTAPALLAAAHGFPMEDRREPAERHEAGDEPVDGLAAVEDEPGGGQDGQEEERSGEDPPRPPDAPILRLRVARSPGGRACHDLKDGGYGR